MRKFFKYFIWVIIAAVFVGTLVFLYKNSHKEPERYNTVSPSRIDISKSTILTGKIEPRDEIEIKPQISGIIAEVAVEPGQRVNIGDVIARIQVVPDASQLSSAQNRVNNARIELANLQSRFDRDSTLYAARVISREEFETSRTNIDKARTELNAALDAYRIVREGISELNASESNTLVRSTITGLVLDVPVKVGTSVIQANTFNDGTTIATVADMTNLIFNGQVDETEVGQLRVGMPVSINIGAMPDYNPEATIEYIAPKGTDNNGANTFQIKAAINAEGLEGLRAGYSANAIVTLASAQNVLTVPESVIEFAGDSTFVYVLADTTAVPTLQNFERVNVSTGMSDGINIEIRDGIDSTALIRSDIIR